MRCFIMGDLNHCWIQVGKNYIIEADAWNMGEQGYVDELNTICEVKIMWIKGMHLYIQRYLKSKYTNMCKQIQSGN